MSGTKDGADAAVRTIKKKYGVDFYAKIGSAGGKNSRSGGFASAKIGADGMTGRERAARAGALGGKISRRSKNSDVQL